jgi:hypothetical protein
VALISLIEPKNFSHASSQESWVKSMKEELNQIEKSETWDLVPRPKDKNVIGTKWVFKNKLNVNGEIIRNKSILVCKGYAQVEGEYFDETFALVARMGAIKLFLAYSCIKKFKVYQMDVKSTFLNGDMKEELYTKKHGKENYV